MPTFRVLLSLLLASASASAQSASLVGRWDLTFGEDGQRYPSWLEVVPLGDSLAGRFQGRFGHATPVAAIRVAGTGFRFLWPSESSPAAAPTAFEGVLIGTDSVRGALITDGRRLAFAGSRAPALERIAPPGFGPAVDLLARGLAGWRLRNPDQPLGWRHENGVLANTPPSTDLVSLETFDDFRLTLEVRVPPGGNSGVYLRGRHEVQIQDDFGKPAGSRTMGSIYGQVTPTELPARPPGCGNRSRSP